MESTVAIIGLGNPGEQYAHTRHNVGFMAIDQLQKVGDLSRLKTERSLCEHASFRQDTARIILVKPMTYMNNSGHAVVWAKQFYKLHPEQILVVYDDIALPLGQTRIRKSGSAGGHNGMKSIIQAIGDGFPRLRIGILSDPPPRELSSYVLAPFTRSDRDTLDPILNRIPDMISAICHDGLDKAMNHFN